MSFKFLMPSTGKIQITYLGHVSVWRMLKRMYFTGNFFMPCNRKTQIRYFGHMPGIGSTHSNSCPWGTVFLRVCMINCSFAFIYFKHVKKFFESKMPLLEYSTLWNLLRMTFYSLTNFHETSVTKNEIFHPQPDFFPKFVAY